MEVDLTVTFDKEEVEKMVLARCAGIATAVPGSFKIHPRYGFIPPIQAIFVPDPEQPVEPAEAPPAPDQVESPTPDAPEPQDAPPAPDQVEAA